MTSRHEQALRGRDGIPFFFTHFSRYQHTFALRIVGKTLNVPFQTTIIGFDDSRAGLRVPP